MAELREYVVLMNGNSTTMQLNEEDAKALDAKLVESEPKASEAKAVVEPPKNKARTPKGK